jgi:hypothetical protein
MLRLGLPPHCLSIAFESFGSPMSALTRNFAQTVRLRPGRQVSKSDGTSCSPAKSRYKPHAGIATAVDYFACPAG